MSDNVSSGHGAGGSVFHKGQIIGLHQAKKTTKEIEEITGTVLRNVQCIINTWKDSNGPSTSNKSTEELAAMFNSKSISNENSKHWD